MVSSGEARVATLMRWRATPALKPISRRICFLTMACRPQLRVECAAIIKNDAVALPVRTTTFFKVFENATL